MIDGGGLGASELGDRLLGVLAVDPPPGSNLTSASLQQLAADAAQRAWELAHGESAAGFGLPFPADLAHQGDTDARHGRRAKPTP
jgi:hypothetical protein